GLAAGLTRGGSVGSLGSLRPRLLWLALLPLAVQYALFGSPLGPQLGAAAGLVHVATYGLLLVPVALNRSIPGMKLVALGLALNATVVAANGGFMPVSPAALHAAGRDDLAASLAQGATMQKSGLMTSAS